MRPQHAVKRLPVVDEDGRIPGIAARRDPLRVFLRTDGDITKAVEHEIGVSTSAVNGTAAAASVQDGVVSPGNRTTWQIDDVLPPYIMWRTR